MQAIRGKDTSIEIMLRKNYGKKDMGIERTIKIYQVSQT